MPGIVPQSAPAEESLRDRWGDEKYALLEASWLYRERSRRDEASYRDLTREWLYLCDAKVPSSLRAGGQINKNGTHINVRKAVRHRPDGEHMQAWQGRAPWFCGRMGSFRAIRKCEEKTQKEEPAAMAKNEASNIRDMKIRVQCAIGHGVWRAATARERAAETLISRPSALPQAGGKSGVGKTRGSTNG
ncbi:hypothetical protein MAPG_01952 [Magnaporthiopsis poae ATCC 64411]|uniref:Uncharacterized protein n=1 Tax=Magnaporthiopsis poae (strain ATCC 64411 / 73-15) TaxID=644358 RepID=A0A0C4DQ17_MAGP6|nr:hypothetical protein MAPG_01952 [Magnaporthiopsis poae ATCC 64411]